MQTLATRWERWAGALLLLAAALLYLATLDTGLRPEELVGGDLITHQYAQVEARPSNAPGYPLYTMGGWLWFRVGRAVLGWALNPVQILSLYSTLWGLAALGVLYLLLLRVTGRRWFLAAPLTAFYAVTYFFWFYSVTTEQYTSAIWQTLLVVWLAFRWEEEPAERWVLWLALVSGSMLANMLTTLFILPPLLWFIFSRRPDYLRRPGLIAGAGLVGLLPVLSYAYVYIRGAQHPEWRGAGQWPSTWQWFLDFVSTRQGRDELAPGLTLSNFFTAEFPSLIWGELTWLVLLGGLAGLIWLGRRRAIFLYSTLGLYALFCWGYRFGNWFQVILPAYPLIVVGFGALVTRLWRLAGGEPIENRPPRSPRSTLHASWGQAALLLLLVALAGYRFALSLPRADQRHRPDDTGLDRGWAILADRPRLPALVAGDFEEELALQYLTTTWGAAPGLVPVTPAELVPPGPAGALAPRRYVTRRGLAAAPDLLAAGAFYPQATGLELIELGLEPRSDLPPGVPRLDLEVGAGLRLLGLERISGEGLLPPGVAERLALPDWRIALYWTAEPGPAPGVTVSVRPLAGGHLIEAGGRPLSQDHPPVWGFYPPERWRAGEVVADVYAVRLPPDLPDDVTSVQILLYRSVTGGFEDLGAVTVSLQSAEIR